IGPCRQQPVDEIEVVVVDGPMQRAGAVRGALIDIGSWFRREDRLRSCIVTRVRGFHQWRRSLDGLNDGPDRNARAEKAGQRGEQRAHQISTMLPLLSPNFSIDTPVRWSIVSSTFASGVRSGKLMWRPPLTVPQARPMSAVGSGYWLCMLLLLMLLP